MTMTCISILSKLRDHHGSTEGGKAKARRLHGRRGGMLGYNPRVCVTFLGTRVDEKSWCPRQTLIFAKGKPRGANAN